MTYNCCVRLISPGLFNLNLFFSNGRDSTFCVAKICSNCCVVIRGFVDEIYGLLKLKVPLI